MLTIEIFKHGKKKKKDSSDILGLEKRMKTNIPLFSWSAIRLI